MKTQPNSLTRLQRVHKIRKHPFIVPVVTFLALIFLSGVAFIALQGKTVGADDSHIVRISVDDQQRVVPTRAATVGELLKRLAIPVGESDIVEPSLDASIIDDDFRINVYRAVPVTIVDQNGRRKQTLSAQPTPRLVAQKAGFSLF